MAFQELKDRQAFVWGNAPFEEVAGSLADVHDAVVAAVGPAEGARWLDVACGTGELAEQAARGSAAGTRRARAPTLSASTSRPCWARLRSGSFRTSTSGSATPRRWSS